MLNSLLHPQSVVHSMPVRKFGENLIKNLHKKLQAKNYNLIFRITSSHVH
jgi:hypothetical protein